MNKVLCLIAMLPALIACEAKVKTETQDQKLVSSGESYNYIVVRIEFLDQINQLCKDSILASEYEDELLLKKAIADCTFDNLSLLNIDPQLATSFNNDYCKEDADLSQFGPNEILNINAACAALEGL